MPGFLPLTTYPLTGSKDWSRQSIFGHSMGGHGALTIYLASKTKQYRSASAFSPIANPSKCPWGEKAFNGYLQGGIEEGKEQYDATELIAKRMEPVHILIDYVRTIPIVSITPSLTLSVRVRVITSIIKGSCYRRTSSRPHEMLGTTNSKFEFGAMRDMTTAIISYVTFILSLSSFSKKKFSFRYPRLLQTTSTVSLT